MSQEQPRYYLRHIRNFCVIVLVLVMAIDALPSCHRFHSDARDRLDPVLDKTGLWQGTWNLFAPKVDTINTCIIAEFYTADGQTYRWQSPDPSELGPIDKFRNFRRYEYYDKVRNNNNSAAWPALASWLQGRTDSVPKGRKIVDFKIWRAWGDVTVDTLTDPVKYPYDDRYMFYRKEGSAK